jgi:hypothetical protein
MRDYPHVRHLFPRQVGTFLGRSSIKGPFGFLIRVELSPRPAHTLVPWLRLRSRCAFGLLLGFLFLSDLAQLISHPAQPLPLRFGINVVVLWSC